MKELVQFLPSFGRESIQAKLIVGETQRQELCRRFPLDAWPQMSLDQYALGQANSKESYSWWLEWGSAEYGGIGGGSSAKHLIYKRVGKEGWYFGKYPDEQTAWEAIRAGFLQAFELAQAERWGEIDAIEPLLGGRMVRMKTLAIYFPDQLLPISSYAHLGHFLAELELPRAQWEKSEIVARNRLLLETLRTIPELIDWSSAELMELLYHWSDPREAKARTVGIAVTDLALWEAWLKDGIIALEGAEVGDLMQVESLKTLRVTVVPLKQAKAFWRFRELQLEDRIIAYFGNQEILAVGTVVTEYQFDEARGEFPHVVSVEWDANYRQRIALPPQWEKERVTEVDAEFARRIRPTEPPLALAESSADPFWQLLQETLEYKKLLILYGPPGTGKTYHARRFAVWWLLRNAGDERHGLVDHNLGAFNSAEADLTRHTPQKFPPLTILTFHPSYSYEDFVEGFRPMEDKSGQGHLQLKLTDGIFKIICREAEKNPQQPYLLLIDEINRANLTKLFGELITLLEKDKRGLSITLPQSRQQLTIPANVYLIGTMNTADHSIKLFDTALRRRFAFIQMMPDPTRLGNTSINGLVLADFLTKLNQRIAQKHGREREIGHAFLMNGGQPIEDAVLFGRIFRQELLPLLQEYCHGEDAQLEPYLGKQLIDVASQRVNEAILRDDQALIAALIKVTAE